MPIQRWQLLWFESVVWNELQPKTEAAFRGFADDERVAPWFTELSRSNRAFAVALEAVAASYMPYISNRISSRGGDAWSPTLTLEAADLVAWLDVDADVLHRQAQLLLAAANRWTRGLVSPDGPCHLGRTTQAEGRRARWCRSPRSR